MTPPAERGDDAEGWLHLTWGDPFDRWQSQGWELCEAELDPTDPQRLITRAGNSALANIGPHPSHYLSKDLFGDLDFRFNFMLPKGGDSGLYFMERYELQLVDDPAWCGGVWSVKEPRVQSAYRGPGIWHTATGRFYAPRFSPEGRKLRNARFENLSIDGVMVIGAAEPAAQTGGGLTGEVPRGHLRFQGDAGLACIADVRVRPLDDAWTTPSEGSQHWDSLLPGGAPSEWRSSGSCAWSFREGILRGEGGPGRISLENPLGEEFNLAARVRVAEGVRASLLLSSPSQKEVARVVLGGTPGALEKAGSISGVAPIRADLIPGGTWYELRLRQRSTPEGAELSVELNGVEMARALLLRSVDAPTTLAFDRSAGEGALELAEIRTRLPGE